MANQNINDMSVTWNDGATTFDAIKMDVTDTASASGSRLFNLSVGGSLYYEATLGRSFNIYNTYTDASNYERLAIKWDTSEATIATEIAGTGSNENLNIDVSSGDLRLKGRKIFLDANGKSEVFYIGFLRDIRVGSNAKHLRVETDCWLDNGVTVANLQSTPSVGYINTVTDASSPTVGSTVIGGGASNALVWYNGSNWTVIGV